MMPYGSNGKIPCEIFMNKKPNLKDLQIFGCDVFVHIPKEKRRNLDERSEKGKFVGFDSHAKALRYYDDNM
jgi:hypothetical protein